MKSNLIIFIIVCFFLCVRQNGFSQNVLELGKRKSVEFYQDRNISSVLSGQKYSLKYPFAVNSQFFEETKPSLGSLIFEGIHFPNIIIQFDEYAQLVIVLLESEVNSSYISLDTDKVSSFAIDGNNFVHIKGDSILPDAIYQKGYTGEEAKIFIKRSKIKKDKTIDGKNVVVFINDDSFYLENERGKFKIENRKTFLKAYGGTNEAKKMLRNNKINFSRNHLEASLIKAVKLFDKTH